MAYSHKALSPANRSIRFDRIARVCLLSLALLATAAAPGLTQAAYPDRPITMIVPLSTGGAGDALARLIGQKMQERLGQPVIIENKPGAGGVLGADFVARAKPDGYTMVMGSSALVVMQAVTPKKMSFDLQKDLAPVTQTSLAPMVFAANPNAPFKDMKGMVAFAKANPAKLSVGVSPGPGGTAHLTLERMKLELGFNAVAIPYKGSSPATLAVLGGEVPVIIDVLSGSAQYFAAGTLRPLGTLTEHRMSPDIPTVAEAGFPGYEANSWNGILVPARTPKAIVDLLDREIVAILALPDVKAKTLEIGFVPPDQTGPKPFIDMIAKDIQTWRRVVKDAKLDLE